VVPRTAGRLAPARGRPRDVDVDQRILASAFRQLVQVGYAGLSIESVASDAGVAKTTIYRRYPTKRDLVVAALKESTPFPAPSPDLPAREALEAFVRTAIAMLVESGAFHVLGSLLVEDQRHPGLLDVFRERILYPRRAMVEEILRRGIERGELRRDVNPLIVIEMIAGAVFAHHVILGLEGDDAWIRSLGDHVWSAIQSSDTN
jgi:AcrR family transcriptional regulator